mgnify:FL=1
MMVSWLYAAALLATAFLFGGMLLFAAGFAAVAFKSLPPAQARALIRQAFPPFYLYVIVTAAAAALLSLPTDALAAAVLTVVALSTVPTRQALMPAINRATDNEQKKRFAWLHGLSVLITLAHIGAAGYVLVRLAG